MGLKSVLSVHKSHCRAYAIVCTHTGIVRLWMSGRRLCESFLLSCSKSVVKGVGSGTVISDKVQYSPLRLNATLGSRLQIMEIQEENINSFVLLSPDDFKNSFLPRPTASGDRHASAYNRIPNGDADTKSNHVTLTGLANPVVTTPGSSLDWRKLLLGHIVYTRHIMEHGYY